MPLSISIVPPPNEKRQRVHKIEMIAITTGVIASRRLRNISTSISVIIIIARAKYFIDSVLANFVASIERTTPL